MRADPPRPLPYKLGGHPADIGNVDRAYAVQSVELHRDVWKMYAKSATQANTERHEPALNSVKPQVRRHEPVRGVTT